MTLKRLNFGPRSLLASVIVLALASSSVQAQDATTEDPEMRSMTDGVLAGLGVVIKKKKTPPKDPEMRNLTNNVLAGLGAAPAKEAEGPVKTDLTSLVSQALVDGKSDIYISALLEEAVVTGEIVVPDELRNSAGSVDTDNLVALLRATALSQGEVAPAALSAEAAQIKPKERSTVGAEGSFPFVPHMQLTKSGRKHFYKVLPLDSLGGIALRAYGDAALYTVIFQANGDRLTNPDKILAGQSLFIPKPDA